QLILKVSVHGQWSGWRASILHPGSPVHIDTDRLPLPGVAVPSGRENQACPSSFTSVDFVVWSIRLSRMLSSPLRSDLADLGAVRSPVPPPFLFSLEDDSFRSVIACVCPPAGGMASAGGASSISHSGWYFFTIPSSISCFSA